MQVATTVFFILLCFGATIISAAIYGSEIRTTDEWWNENYFLKFNSPGGKKFFISFFDGTIHREGESPFVIASNGSTDEQTSPLPFISFISIDLRIYDIHFDSGDLNDVPRVEETKFVYKNKYFLIRHRLDSFVGPDKRVYKVTYNNDDDEPNVTVTESSSQLLDDFQIKTLGPYEKWEHTYDFSENGVLVVDHTLSSVPVLPNRSIAVPKLEPNAFVEPNFINVFVKFNAPSGTKYHITNQLNIVAIRSVDDDAEDVKAAYITFTEPNGRTYDINIDDENGRPVLVEKSVVEENYYTSQRLYSFVTPNRMLYRIDHKNESDHEVPILVSNSSKAMELQITFSRPEQYYNAYVKYIFSDDGMKLFDRVDEIDWSPLNDRPAVSVDEMISGEETTKIPFLTFFTPSGNNYHIFTDGGNASIAVEKVTKNSQPLYITYFQTNGRKTNIYFTPGDHPYLEEEPTLVEMPEKVLFFLISFVTPDKRLYHIKSTSVADNEWKQFVELPAQAREPIDKEPEDGLTIRIQDDSGWQNIYRFTWNGDKLIEAAPAPPSIFVDSRVLQSLIGK